MSSSFLDLGLAFLEGLGLIVSPCILPLLPLILATSVEGGRARPYGIILGFILSFTLFAYFSRGLITSLNIDPEYIKYTSLVLLAAFGLTLLSETLSERFAALTNGAASLGARFGGSQKGGFARSLGIGALIGLVWTPCAGPFLAAVLVQVIRQETDLEGLLVLLSFSIGVGVPMFIIALTGRRLVDRLAFLKRHALAVRRFFGVLLLLAVAFIASGADALTLFQTRGSDTVNKEEIMNNTSSTATPALLHGLRDPYPAPALEGLEGWLNSPPLTMDALRGKVVLVDFWTYSCINCVRTFPYLLAWDKKYREQGLVILGIHAPEFVFERKAENVKNAVEKYGIRYPVAQDNNFTTWRNYDNRYWPAHYLINREGQVVYTHFGEGQYDVTENNIRVLLGVGAETAAQEAVVATSAYSANQTPETYLGAERAARNKNDGAFRQGAAQSFKAPEEPLERDEWALHGVWTVDGEKSVAAQRGAKLLLRFQAGKIFLVMGTSTGQPVKARIMLNGGAPLAAAGKDAPEGVVTVDHNTLYELVSLGAQQTGVLEIIAEEEGLEVYAFTFGS